MGGWHPKKILMKRGSSCSSGAIHQIPSSPPPLLNNKMNRILLGYRSSERAVDHEKFRAIKKKLSTQNKLTSSIHPSGFFGGSNSKSHNHFELDSMVHNLGMYCIPLLSLIIVKPRVARSAKMSKY